MNFASFCLLREAKFSKLDDDTINQINIITNNLYKIISNNKSKNVEDIGKIPILNIKIKDKTKIGIINVTLDNKKIKIPVILTTLANAIAGQYYEDSNTIELNINKIVFFKRNEIYSILTHEVIHALQKYKKTSQKYKNAVDELNKGKEIKNPKDYYTEPAEMEAQLSGLMYNIKSVYTALKRKNLEVYKSKSAWKNDKDKFLLTLRLFIKSPYETYGDFLTYGEYKELELPYFLQPYLKLLRILHSNVKLWRKFKLKLVDLYNELKNED